MDESTLTRGQKGHQSEKKMERGNRVQSTLSLYDVRQTFGLRIQWPLHARHNGYSVFWRLDLLMAHEEGTARRHFRGRRSLDKEMDMVAVGIGSLILVLGTLETNVKTQCIASETELGFVRCEEGIWRIGAVHWEGRARDVGDRSEDGWELGVEGGCHVKPMKPVDGRLIEKNRCCKRESALQVVE